MGRISLTLLFSAASALAADICVGPAATGSGTGADWNNVFAWTGTLVRGNTYYLQDGTYAAKVLSVAESGTTRIIIKKATASAHVTETGWTSTLGDGQAEFLHNNVTTYGGNCLWIQSGYWTIDGVTGSGNTPGTYGFKLLNTTSTNAGQYAYASRIFISTGDGLTLAHLEFEPFDANDHGKGAIEQASSGHWDNSTVSHCWFSGAQYLAALNSTDNVILEYLFATNSFSSTWHHGDLINMKALTVGDPCTNITIRYCVFANHTGTGGVSANDAVTGISADYLYIYGNVFGGQLPTNYNGGNGYINATTKGGLNHCYVFNNTFSAYGTGHDAWLGACGQGGGVCVATNNLLYNMSAAKTTNAWKCDYNYYLNCTDTNSLGEANSVFVSGASAPFKDYASKDFRLTVATPAGLTLPSPYTTDADGNMRGSDGAWDIGAYEYIVLVEPTQSRVAGNVNAGTILVR